MAGQRKRGRMPKQPKQAKRRVVQPAAKRAQRRVEVPAAARTGGDRALVIAGVGASAGGLEAFSQLLESMPKNPGLAIVLVQHLAPQHESALPLLLSGRTPMPVVQATEGVAVERDRVYVIPPNTQMGIRDGVLHLLPRPSDRTQYTPIDYFFRSLAHAADERAIGFILSGTASDGTAGVREIKAVGGITIAQSPDTARYDGMPRAAIGSGFIDLILSPAKIARELVSIASHPLNHRADKSAAASEEDSLDHQMEQVFALLRTTSGVDFRRYKRPTIERRLQRRMVLHKLTRLDHYIRYLREHPPEVQALFADILIHVTRFFRDAESLAMVSTQVLPKIVQGQSSEQPVRVWVPGCSTGEEAYSVAMLILEYFSEHALSFPVQIFATDISDPAIEHARAGLYPEGIAADVTPERLRRFFSKVEGGFRINKTVRDVCVFARQDLTRDPPFSKLDFIVCRNVLIYLGTDLQKKLMGVFHYALKPNGFLMLGSAESIGSGGELFTTVERKHRVFQKRVGASPDVPFPTEYVGIRQLAGRPHEAPTGAKGKSVENEATRVLQERYAPPGVVVDGNCHVVQFRGQTGAYLEPAPGEPSLNLLKMAREGLLHGLRDAFQQARKTKAAVRKRGLRVRANGSWRTVDLEVVPLVVAEAPHFLVLFDDVTDGGSKFRERRQPLATGPESDRGGPAPSRRVAQLRRELASSREYLQSIIQDLEAANEELQSANEEVLSANEELQSTNEELDTAKEELQSTNEELNTVNEELHSRNEELSRVNSDLVNLLSSVEIAIVIVASDLRIRRFTPSAERVLNLIAGDVGRPISHIKPNIECPDLEELIAHVVDTVTPCEREVRDQQGNYYSLRIRPYKNLENRIDGAVLALFESQSSKQQHERLLQTVAGLIEPLQEPVLVLDATLRVRALNRAFAEAFGVRREDALQQPLYSVDGGRWNTDRLRALFESDLAGRPAVDGVTIEQPRVDGAPRRIVVNARRLSPDGGREPIILLSLKSAEGTSDRQ